MRLDQLNGLLALSKVAEKQSFSAAAIELRVTPSALSQSVRQLETRLGVALLARTTRSTRLTEAGARFLERTGPALKEILASLDLVEHYAKAPSGLLRITISKIGFNAILAPVLAGFRKAYPNVSVEIGIADEFVDIIGEGFDAGIRFGENVSRDMTSLRLSKPFRWAIAGAPRYFARHGHPKRPEDLLDHDCIRYRFADGDLYEDYEFTRDGKEFSVRIGGGIIVNEPHAAIELATQGLGLSYQAEHTMAPWLKSGKLVLTLEKYYPTSDGYFLYYPSRNQVQPKLRAFIDYLKQARAW